MSFDGTFSANIERDVEIPVILMHVCVCVCVCVCVSLLYGTIAYLLIP
jgi:hypothetical protein